MTNPMERAARLACWNGDVAPQPLGGGITNVNFTVEDAGERYVVRIGEDIPVHGVYRATELASARAAYAAGISPEIVHAEPGALVMRWVDGRTLEPADVRDPARLERVLDTVRRCHREIPPHFRGATPIFWVFQVVRDYARALREDGSRMAGRLDDLLRRAAHLESVVGPVEIAFGHNDLLAANFIDDGDRIWLIDWEYAGFNSPLFDLGGLASNNELDVASGMVVDRALLRFAARRSAARELRRDEVRFAAARDDVEHGLGAALRDRFRLCRLHRGEPRTLRAGVGADCVKSVAGHERARPVSERRSLRGCSRVVHGPCQNMAGRWIKEIRRLDGADRHRIGATPADYACVRNIVPLRRLLRERTQVRCVFQSVPW